MMVGFVLLYPDKNIMVCCSKYIFSDFMAAILNFMFFKKKTIMRAPHPPRYHHREPAKYNQNRNKLSFKTMLVAVSLRYPVVFAYICINIDVTIFFSKNKFCFLIPENIRIDILCMSLA